MPESGRDMERKKRKIRSPDGRFCARMAEIRHLRENLAYCLKGGLPHGLSKKKNGSRKRDENTQEIVVT